MNLFELPPSVLVYLIFAFLESNSIANLDSAFCNNSNREMFSQLFRYGNVHFEQIFNSNKMLSSLNWITGRGVNTNNILIQTKINEKICMKIILDSSLNYSKLTKIWFENCRIATKCAQLELCSVISKSTNLLFLALINLIGAKEFMFVSINSKILENLTHLILVSNCKPHKTPTYGHETFQLISGNCKSLICLKISFVGAYRLEHFPLIQFIDFIQLPKNNRKLEELVLDCALDISGTVLNEFYSHCPQLKQITVQMANSTSSNDYQNILTNADEFEILQTYSLYYDKFKTNEKQFTLCLNRSELSVDFSVSDDFIGSHFLQNLTHVSFDCCLISQVSLDKFCGEYSSTLTCFSYTHNCFELSPHQLQTILKFCTKLERILLAPFTMSNADTCSIFHSAKPKTLKCITCYECRFIQISAVLMIITETLKLNEIFLNGTNGKIDKQEVKKYFSLNKELRLLPKMSFK
jgi:hypothetical protein